MITTLVRRVIPLIGVGVFFGLTVRRTMLPPPEGDLWFHLRLGQEFLKGWAVSAPGHLGVYDTEQWLPSQWLSQMALSQVEQRFGLAGVLVLVGLVHLTIILTIYLMCRDFAGALPAGVATVLCLASVAAGLTARPQVLSYLFVVVTIWAWLRTARDLKPRYGLVALAWLWVPLHGMWPIGLVLSSVLALGVVLDARPGRRVALRLLSIPALSILISFATPLGWRAFDAVIAVSSRSQYFSEWGPPDFTDLRSAGIVVMLVWVLSVELQRGPMSRFHLLLLLLGVACAIYSTRTVPIAAIIFAPLLANAVAHIVPSSSRPGRIEYAALAAMMAAAVVALATVAPTRARVEVIAPWLNGLLAQQPAGTRVLNDWDSGAYFLWRYPHLDLVMHGYGDVFTDAEIKRNADISLARSGWEKLVADLDADMAVVVPDTPLAYALTRNAGWTLIAGDDDFQLLAPPDH